MAAALDASNYIYEGLWINWARGPVMGLTLTINPNRAAILSPALAILVSTAGVQLWRLFQFALHQVRASPKRRPMIYHQIQVTIRNSATDLSTLWRLLRLGIAWREWKPLMTLATCAFVHLVFVLTLGIFSSWLLLSNNDVIAKSPWCGLFNQTYYKTVYSTNSSDPLHSQLVTQYNEYLYGRFALAQQHVDICSASNGTCRLSENRPRKLSWTSKYVPQACPFDSSICNSKAGAMSFDTGLLSSHTDFGFNAVEGDRIAVRMSAVCAPLDDAAYTSTLQNISTTNQTQQITDALYGPSQVNTRNATYSLRSSSSTCEQRLNTAPYILTSYFATANSSIAAGTATFDAIPVLKRSDADTSLMILAFNDAYIAPVTDPWFSAQKAIPGSPEFCAKTNRTLYVRERPLTAIGCTQQWQICGSAQSNQENEFCTPPLARSQIWPLLNSANPGILLNPRQLATAQRVLTGCAKANFYFLILALARSGSSPLKAQYYVNSVTSTISSALPADQWQIETSYWMDLLMAFFQQNVLDYSTGQFVASTSYVNTTKPPGVNTTAADNAAYWLCQNQIIESTVYRNFNFIAMLITCVVCCTIILLGLCIEDCVGCCRERRHRYTGPEGKGKQDMWIANSDLGMLRAVDELKNQTQWTLSRNGIPRTGPGYEISVSDLMIDGYDVEKGKGIVPRSVRKATMDRQQRDKAQRPLLTHQSSSGHTRGSSTGISSDGSGVLSPYQHGTHTRAASGSGSGYFSYAPMRSDPFRSGSDVQLLEMQDMRLPQQHSSSALTFSNEISRSSTRDLSRHRSPPAPYEWPWLNESHDGLGTFEKPASRGLRKYQN